MNPSKNCIDLIKKFEALRFDSYLCPASIPTIGYGNTRWENGMPIKLGEKVNIQRAEQLLINELNRKSLQIQGLNLNQNQFDAILSLIYNIGLGNFQKSTLLKKIKSNPNDITIKSEFLKWNKARIKGVLVELKGLTRRRQSEAELYFKVA